MIDCVSQEDVVFYMVSLHALLVTTAIKQQWCQGRDSAYVIVRKVGLKGYLFLFSFRDERTLYPLKLDYDIVLCEIKCENN